jgi:hypothetical protein
MYQGILRLLSWRRPLCPSHPPSANEDNLKHERRPAIVQVEHRAVPPTHHDEEHALDKHFTLVVRDRMPLSEDERIKVTAINPHEKAIGPAVPSAVNLLGSGAVGTSKDAGVAETLTVQIEMGSIARWAQTDNEGAGRGGSSEGDRMDRKGCYRDAEPGTAVRGCSASRTR